MPRLLLFTGVVSSALLGALLALVLYALARSSDGALPGTTVAGYAVPTDEALGDWLERRRLWLLDREAYLRLPDTTIETSLGALGIEVDVAGTMALVAEQTRSSGLLERVGRLVRARFEPPEAPLRWRFDERRAAALLETVAAEVRREPVNARLELRLHRRIEDVPGRRLDIPLTIRSMVSTRVSDPAIFVPVVQSLPARVTSAMLVDVDVSKVLSTYETSFAGKAGRRAVNIAVAARYLNETVIPPGGILSFNRTVGERRPERGFVEAPVIVEDELEQGYGGGVCQVASTLHAAAVYGSLLVPRRRSHSRPSGYISLGLDATVIDGEVDLQLQNPYDTPLIVHAFLPTKTSIRVELLGRDPPGEVRHTYGVVESQPFTRRVRIVPELGADFIQRKQKGNPGYDVVSYVSLTKSDGSRTTRTYSSKYYPVPEVYWVGSEVARDHELPPLPEGATAAPEGDAGAQGENAAPEARESVHRGNDPSPDPYESSRRSSR